jgi:hypothetical protein
VSPVRYELVCYIPEDGIPHSHRRENLESYMFDVDYIFNVQILSDISRWYGFVCVEFFKEH